MRSRIYSNLSYRIKSAAFISAKLKIRKFMLKIICRSYIEFKKLFPLSFPHGIIFDFRLIGGKSDMP